MKYKAHSDVLARREGHDLVVPLSPSCDAHVAARAARQAHAPGRAPAVPRAEPPDAHDPHHRAAGLHVGASSRPAATSYGGEFGRAPSRSQRDPKDPRVIVVKRERDASISTSSRSRNTPRGARSCSASTRSCTSDRAACVEGEVRNEARSLPSTVIGARGGVRAGCEISGARRPRSSRSRSRTRRARR